MENKVTAVDIILSVILFIVGCCGICVTVSRSSGELTLENYTEYLDISCYTHMFFGNGGGYIEGNGSIIINPNKNFQIQQLEFEYIITDEYMQPVSGNISEYYIDYNKPYEKPLKVIYRYSSNIDILNKPISSPKIEVVSISGKYQYRYSS